MSKESSWRCCDGQMPDAILAMPVPSALPARKNFCVPGWRSSVPAAWGDGGRTAGPVGHRVFAGDRRRCIRRAQPESSVIIPEDNLGRKRCRRRLGGWQKSTRT